MRGQISAGGVGTAPVTRRGRMSVRHGRACLVNSLAHCSTRAVTPRPGMQGRRAETPTRLVPLKRLGQARPDRVL
jgi:hypothetical protein